MRNPESRSAEDRILERLAGDKLDNLLGLDLDRLAGGGIAARASRTLAQTLLTSKGIMHQVVLGFRIMPKNFPPWK